MGSFEATNVVVARINKLDPENASLATLVLFICMNTASTIWMIPLGLSGAIRAMFIVTTYKWFDTWDSCCRFLEHPISWSIQFLGASNFLDGVQCSLRNC
ncbi:uncharacterized protein DS421_3g101240 [Arachis hypogaea]|nr:uncharacterized protein DS421_3g101240 [Arachis hypogaea]